eukprot:4694134-Amphidinium_carterae.4
MKPTLEKITMTMHAFPPRQRATRTHFGGRTWTNLGVESYDFYAFYFMSTLHFRNKFKRRPAVRQVIQRHENDVQDLRSWTANLSMTTRRALLD